MPIFHEEKPIDAEQVRQYAERLSRGDHPQELNIDGADIRPLGQGYNNQLFELVSEYGAYVLKIYPRDRTQRLIRENKVLNLLNHTGVVPEVVLAVTVAEELEAPVLLYKKLPGAPVEISTADRQDLDHLQAVWHTVHGADLPDDPIVRKKAGPYTPEDNLRYIEKTIQSIDRTNTGLDAWTADMVKSVKDAYREVKRRNLRIDLWREPIHTICQADCRPANVLKVADGEFRLVDWEHAGVMDPLYEVAGFVWHPESLGMPAENRNYVIRAYCDQSRDLFAFEKIQVYQWILPVQWAVRILSLIIEYDRQIIQPWVTPRSVEALKTDVLTYLDRARRMRDGVYS